MWMIRSSREVLCKKVFLKILKNTQENTCARVFFLIMLQASVLKTALVAASECWRGTFGHKSTQKSIAINSIADYNCNCKATLKCD